MYGNAFTDGVFVMPKQVLKYLGSAKNSELKVIVYLFSKGIMFNKEQAAIDLGESEEEIMSALSFWRGAGIITEKEDGSIETAFEETPVSEQAQVKEAIKSKSRADRAYTTSEIADIRKNDGDFSHLVDFVEKNTGILMNSAHQGDLLYLYDNLAIPCDVIMGIVAHCVSVDKGKMRYIVKTAEGIYNDGVRTYKELENYLAAKNSYKEFTNFIRTLTGAGTRGFTAAEEKWMKTWESEYKLSRELVTYAYERTIALISKPSLAYMAKILENWYKDGIDTVEKAKSAVENKSGKQKVVVDEKAKKAGFDIDLEDIFERPDRGTADEN